MLNFFWGVLVGFLVGYPIGLWASCYTYKEIKRRIDG